MTIIDKLLKQIKTFPTVKPAYSYDEEVGINAAYTPLIKGRACPLELNEKRIWCLRSDLILALGIKNDNQALDRSYADYFDPQVAMGYSFPEDSSISPYFDDKNRYGHPTLAMPEPEHKYDGSVFYAGWIAQRKDSIDMYVFTGRFENKLDSSQVTLLQRYIALKCMEAFGAQPIIFYKAPASRSVGYDLLIHTFLKDKPLVLPNTTYTPHSVQFSKAFAAGESKTSVLAPDSPLLSPSSKTPLLEGKGEAKSLEKEKNCCCVIL